MFVKTSPYSSTYGMYGAGSVNPYSGYFGNNSTSQQSAISPLGSFQQTSVVGGGGFGVGSGSPSFIVPQPTETKIIGGLDNTGENLGLKKFMSPTGSAHNNPFGSSIQSPGRFDTSQQPEPMHYSPIGGSSPISTGTNFGSPTNTVYLPCYFLGLDQSYQGSPPSPSGNLSANLPLGRFSSNSLSPQKGLKKKVLFEPTLPDEESGMESLQESKKSRVLQSPPAYGFGSSNFPTTQEFLDSVTQQNKFGANKTKNIDESSSPMSCSPTSQNSSAKCWVTTFGFPQGANSFILTNFSSFGKILEVKCTPGSNWLHIRFSNSIEARRALAKNGKVLGQSIMVGVIPSDPNVIENAERHGDHEVDKTFSAGHSARVSPILRERNGNAINSDGSASLKTRIRPLAASGYTSSTVSPSSSASTVPRTRNLFNTPVIAREPLEVERSFDGGSVPAPSNGVLSKALEFMFGW